MPEDNRKLFMAAHYNAIAKDIRELYVTQFAGYSRKDIANFTWNRALEELAIKFAQRFKVDNEGFDPIKFLTACSPNPDLYPIAELWDDKA